MARRDNEHVVKVDAETVVNKAIEARQYETDTRKYLNELVEAIRLREDAARLVLESEYEYNGVNKRELEATLGVLEQIRDELADETRGKDLASASKSESLAERRGVLDALLADGNLSQSWAFMGDVVERNRAAEEDRIASETAKNEAKKLEAEAKTEQAKATKEFYERQARFVSEVTDNGVSGAAGSLLGMWWGLNDGDYSPIASALGGALGQTSEFEGGASGLAGLLEGLGHTGAAAAVGELGMTLSGPAFAGVMASMAIVGELNSTIMQNRYAAMQQGLTGIDALTLGPGAALQDTLYEFAGFDSRTMQNVRSMLFNNQAEWGTEEYDQGFDFSLNAQGRYGISADRAARYYTDMVVKGGESMYELNEQMETLQRTVENTSIGMEQMDAVIKSNTSTLAGAIGGDSLAAQGMALEMQGYYTEGTGRESQIAAGIVGNVNFAQDPLAYDKFQEYRAEGYDETQAMMLASMDYVTEGRVLGTYGGINYFATPLTPNGETIADYLAERDFDGLEAALEEFWNSDYGNGMTYFGLRAALKSQFGFTDQDVESPQTIADAFRGVMGGFDSAAEGESSQVNDRVAYDRGAGRTITDAAHIGTSYTGLSLLDKLSGGTSEVDFTDTWGNLSTEAYSFAALLRDAGVDFGEDGITGTELELTYAGLRDVWQQSGTDMSLTDWMITDEGKESAVRVAGIYENDTPASTEAATQRQGFDITVALKDGLDQIFRVFVSEANDAEARDRGEQAGG